MLTAITKGDWTIVPAVIDAARSQLDAPGHDDRKLLVPTPRSARR